MIKVTKGNKFTGKKYGYSAEQRGKIVNDIYPVFDYAFEFSNNEGILSKAKKKR